MHIITIDCGASFLKGALYKNDILCKRVQTEAPKVNQDTDLLHPVQINGLISAFHDLLKQLSADSDTFTLCISNEMHGFLLAEKDGTPYTDYISWQKEYGNIESDGISAVEMIKQSSAADEIQKTGMPLRGGLPSCNLCYLNCQRVLKEGLYFYTLGDYLIRELTGKQPVSHITNAASTGLVDLEKGDWNPKLLNVVGGDKLIFPGIGKEKTEFTFNGKKAVVLPAIGDQQAALFGAGFFGTDAVSFNLGTGAQVSRISKDIIYSDKFQTRPYFDNCYLCTIPHLPSGRALNVFIRYDMELLRTFIPQITEEKLWETILEKESAVTDTMLRCELSFFEVPFSDHTTGSIRNIGEYALKPYDLFHTVFKEMAKNYRTAADILFPEKKEVKHIVFSGGVARRIKRIQQYVTGDYAPDVKITIGENETLEGLHRYGKSY